MKHKHIVLAHRDFQTQELFPLMLLNNENLQLDDKVFERLVFDCAESLANRCQRDVWVVARQETENVINLEGDEYTCLVAPD